MLHRHICSFTWALALLATGCGGDHKESDATTHGGTHPGGSTSSDDTAATTSGSTTGAALPPAAPTDLTANILEGGVHITWKDVADNEDNYVIENKAAGEADFSVVIEMPFDSVTYHDIDVMAATAYTYRVKAVNAAGESLSTEVMVQVP